MEDLSNEPSPAELALIEADLPEWERLAVRDYWDAVVAEEIGEVPLPVNALDPRAFVTQELLSGRGHQNSGDASVLRFPGTQTPRSASDSDVAAA